MDFIIKLRQFFREHVLSTAERAVQQLKNCFYLSQIILLQYQKRIILDIAKALQLLSENKIVHSDLKTENILISLKTGDQIKGNPSQRFIFWTKLIDYDSLFVFNSLKQVSMATPQYMAPDMLNFIVYQNQDKYFQKYQNSWLIDVWSLGIVILQIISGIPLWMSLKTVGQKKHINDQIWSFCQQKQRLHQNNNDYHHSDASSHQNNKAAA